MNQSKEIANNVSSAADQLDFSPAHAESMPIEHDQEHRSAISTRRVVTAGLATAGIAIGFAGADRNSPVNEAYASTGTESTESVIAQAAAGCKQKKLEFYRGTESGFELMQGFNKNSVSALQSSYQGYPGRKNKNKYASITMGFARGGKRKYSWNHIPGIKTSAVVINRTGPNSRKSVAIKCFKEQRKLGGYVLETSQQIKQGTRNRSVMVWFSKSR
jgi:hypothetical protein